MQVNHKYQQILEDLIENLQSAGQEYTPEQAEGWAWDYFFKKYPEYDYNGDGGSVKAGG